VPGNAAGGSVAVTARGAAGSATTTIAIPLRPTPTPKPTAKPTSVPPTSAPPTATPTATPKVRPPFKFQYVSLWYHTVRQGTWDMLVVQSALRVKLGIWVHVYFPNGSHLDYYENTGNRGLWSKRFDIPANAANSQSNQALITIRLWHGSTSIKNFLNFTLV